MWYLQNFDDNNILYIGTIFRTVELWKQLLTRVIWVKVSSLYWWCRCLCRLPFCWGHLSRALIVWIFSFLLLLQFGYWISFNFNSTSIFMLKVTWKTGDAYIGMRSSPTSSSTTTSGSITDAREGKQDQSWWMVCLYPLVPLMPGYGGGASVMYTVLAGGCKMCLNIKLIS